MYNMYKTIDGVLFRKGDLDYVPFGRTTLDQLQLIIDKCRAAMTTGQWREIEAVVHDDYDSPTLTFEGLRRCSLNEIEEYERRVNEWEKNQALKEKAEFERLKAKFESGK